MIKRSESDGQIDMFSAFSDASGEEYVYTDREEFSGRELLAQERESTGMYFSGHPSDEYSAMAEKLGAVPIGEVIFGADDDSEEKKFRDGDRVTVAGTVTERVGKKTRSGAAMAFVRIEDRFGEIEAIVFPKILEKSSAFLTEGSAVAMIGTVSETENAAPKLICDIVIPLSNRITTEEAEPVQAEKKEESIGSKNPDKPKTIYLRLPSLEGEIFEKIKSVLDIFTGEMPVMLYGEAEKKYIKRVGAGVDLQPNMLALLKKLLGEENIVIK